MTQEEYLRRMQNDKYKELKVTTGEKGEPYVFISYKSDSWEKVLAEIVYKLQTEYGLRVYFDKSFNSHNNIWTEQFPKNMAASNCKAVLAFVDNKYARSYATLLELMYSQTCLASHGKGNGKGLPVIPVCMETVIANMQGDDQDTGLGVEIYEGKVNENAAEEKKVFDKTFDELKRRRIFKEDKDAIYLYDGEQSLTRGICRSVVSELYATLKLSKNDYYDNAEFYHDLVGTIKSVAPDVFGGVREKEAEPESIATDDKAVQYTIEENSVAKVICDVSNNGTDMRVVSSSVELRRLLESDECKDNNLKKSIKENRVQLRISGSDISFREEYMKYKTWLFSFDKSEPDADKWDFYILRKGDGDAGASSCCICLDATDLKTSVPIKKSIRKSHFENIRKVSLAELLSGKWTQCFAED